jgi:hypothetical protein
MVRSAAHLVSGRINRILGVHGTWLPRRPAVTYAYTLHQSAITKHLAYSCSMIRATPQNPATGQLQGDSQQQSIH